MENRWSEQEAARHVGELGQQVYASRLLGRDSTLVLHGGGNTSVKVRERNIFGEAEDILYVKGSGWDLETIEPAGFAPCRLAHLLRLAQLVHDLPKILEIEINPLRVFSSGAVALDIRCRIEF